MTPAPMEAILIPNIFPFCDIKTENITPINSQTELQDVTPKQDHVVFPKINEAIETDFKITTETDALHDLKFAIEKRNYMHLLTIHESLRNTSFHTILLLCLAGILPRDLANVSSPLCPG